LKKVNELLTQAVMLDLLIIV